VFLDNKIISRWTYNNIIVAGLLRKEFDWVKTFIYDYAECLPEKHREASFNYNLAKYYYEVGNYKEAMFLLQQMEYDDLLHTMGAKIILAKMYYELSEVESLDSLIKSAQAFIYRKKVLGYHKEVYLSIFGIFKKLMSINPHDKSALKQLENEISTTKQLPEKDWLLAQAQKLR
jgi:tetratricopeptide (TPR) repeat protein